MCVPGGTLIFVPSIQGYLSDRGTLDKQEVLLGDVVSIYLLSSSYYLRGGIWNVNLFIPLMGRL